MPSLGQVTLRQIAAAAGVSHVTVSRALRNDPSIPRTTARRIQSQARRMGYRPNPLVSALMTQVRLTRPHLDQPTIAYLNAWWPPPAWESCNTKTSQFAGARRRAAELGYKVENFWLGEPKMTERRMAQLLRARGIQGILVGPLADQSRSLTLPWKDFTLSTIGYSLRDPDLPRASHAHFRGMYRAMGELISRGYQRIGYVTSFDFEDRVSSLWGAAYRLQQFRLDPGDRIDPLIFPKGAMAGDLQAWLRQCRPDAVIASLPGVFESLAGFGALTRPHFAFVHVDLPAKLRARGVSGIDQLSDKVGALAVELIISQLYTNVRGLPPHPATQLIEGVWVEGNTAGWLAAPVSRRRNR